MKVVIVGPLIIIPAFIVILDYLLLFEFELIYTVISVLLYALDLLAAYIKCVVNVQK